MLTELPEEININDKSYPVRSDFLTWINVERILCDIAIPGNMKLFSMTYSLDLFKGDMSIFNEDQEEVIKSIINFWNCNKDQKKNKSLLSNPNDIPYDYDIDFNLIAAAFMQQYRIDLRSINMHWFVYKALFDGLSKETRFVEIVGYRTMKINKLPKEQREDYRRLKDYYKITRYNPLKRSQKEIEAELLAKLNK